MSKKHTTDIDYIYCGFNNTKLVWQLAVLLTFMISSKHENYRLQKEHKFTDTLAFQNITVK